MCLLFHMTKKIIERIMNATREATEIFNSSTIILAKNPVFHDKSKHIDTRFHYLRDCIANKKIKVKYMKTQYQVADIFTKL